MRYACLLTALALVACQSAAPKPIPAKLSIAVDGLEPRQDDLGGLIFTRPGQLPLAHYQNFLLLPVEIEAPGLGERTSSDRARLELYFSKAVVRELSGRGYSVVSRPQPSTLSVRLIVTGITTGDASADPISGLLLDVPFEVIDATIEAQFRDAESGELQAVSLHRLESQTGLITDWDSAHTVFDLWARLFRQAIDKARAPG